MDLDINKIKQEALDLINNKELDDSIIRALQYHSIEVPGFIYRKDDPGLGGLYTNVKHMGIPENIEYNQLSKEEADELDWAQKARIESFVEELNQKYGEISITGRSGGYWGLPLNNVSDLVKVNISDDKLNEIINKSISFSETLVEEGYDIIDNEYDMASYAVDNIKSALDEYVTLQPTEKLLNFKKDIEEEAKRWESMDFAQYVSLI